MPGLLRGVARTAVVAGTATAVSGRVQRRQARRYAESDAEIAAEREQAYEQQVQPQAAAPAAPAPAAPSENDTITQLEKLGKLRDQGILTDDEFTAEKAKILGG